MKKIEFTHPALRNEETGEHILLLLPSHKIVCPCCGGEGNHFRSDLDENALLQGIQDDGDYESLDAYHRGGFNQRCTNCNGFRVVDEIDWEYFQSKHPAEAQEIREWEREERESRRYAQMERRAGA
jgi:hypothetical protein